MQINMISIIIPIYNEEENILELCNRIISSLESYSCEYEIILIENGSTDNSLKIIKEYEYICLYYCLQRSRKD